MIYDLGVEHGMEIRYEDKREFQQSISILSNEFRQESTDFTKGK